MSVPFAYIGVIMIWSTTPLAILWSSQEVGFLFGVTSRMIIGAMLALIVTALLGLGMRWHRRALLAYMVSGLGIYGGMLSIYWAAQYIPSGWISLIFGLTPVITGLMAGIWLKNERLNAPRIGGMALGLAGLAVIFGSSMELSHYAALGVGGVLLGATIHSASGVWLKRLNADVPAIVLASGGLTLAAPLYLLTWLLIGEPLPATASARTIGSIGYLALFGSVIGFALYFHVLRHVQATKVALITLVAPVMALTLGSLLNGEVITTQIITGALLILSGLALFELGDRLPRLRGLRE
jgi:drug/metabolite transporter (DMT)-like permease